MSAITGTRNELVVIERTEALSVFTTPGAIDPILRRIREEIDKFSAPIDTSAGRKAIASMAYKVAQSKTYLEGIGKDLAAEQKEIPKKIDATRKHVRDTLDAWRDEVRAPLTAWEEAEDSRIKAHQEAIIYLLRDPISDATPDELRGDLAHAEAVVIGPACEEFEAEYARAKDQAITKLSAALELAEKREADAAELARLRAEAAAREEADRIERVKREAAEKAKAEAEAAAQAERDEAARRELALKEAAERAEREAVEREARLRRDAEEAATRAAIEAERRELELQRQKAEAEARARDAEAKARADAEAERKREAEEAAARERNRAHRAKINNAVVAALVAGGIDQESAKVVVTLIAQAKVPNVKISY